MKIPLSKFDYKSTGAVEITIPDGTVGHRIGTRFTHELPFWLVNRNGYERDVIACLGFMSLGRSADEIANAMEEKGCHPARPYQGVAILVELFEREKLSRHVTYLVIGEKVQNSTGDCFMKLEWRETKPHLSLIPEEDLPSLRDAICVGVRPL